MGNQESSSVVGEAVPPETLGARTLSAVAEHVKTGAATKIVVMTGAGISTSAGIPDFRSPKTGLYTNLRRLKLPYPEAVFDISYFRKHPEPFYMLAKELYPGNFSPTISHCFIALLEKKGLLSMLFTQNIDCLERAAGVSAEKIVEAHGSFASQRCIECKVDFPADLIKDAVENSTVPRCNLDGCNGLVKPDIVFFGEPLPKRFNEKSHAAASADLVLIIGTSLSVYPFGALPEMVGQKVPRVLFNLERVGRLGMRPDDVLALGPSDAGLRQLAEELGWLDELEEMWRALVGEDEAEKQIQRQRPDNVQMQREMDQLGDNLEAALNLEDKVSGSSSSDEDDEAADLQKSMFKAMLEEHIVAKSAVAASDDANNACVDQGGAQKEEGRGGGEDQVESARGADCGGKKDYGVKESREVVVIVSDNDNAGGVSAETSEAVGEVDKEERGGADGKEEPEGEKSQDAKGDEGEKGGT